MERSQSKEWRIRTCKTYSTWAWDICALKFYDISSQQLIPCAALSSGSANQTSFSAEGAVMKTNAIWGGRPVSCDNGNSEFFLGAVFSESVSVAKVHFLEPHEKHSSVDGEVMLQYLNANVVWCNERLIETLERSDKLGVGIVRTGPAPSADELVSKPSRPLKGEIHGCCYKARIHCNISSNNDNNSALIPDLSFYHYENCEGLYVCVSHACGLETLHEASALIRSLIPEEHRKLWSQFRSPKWAKDCGPMRLIVLDNRTKERAGMIPELNDSSASRNCVNCPFVFTSREDFYDGVSGFMKYQLSTHEITHGADMVIRQLIDPAFDEIIEEMYQKYRQLLCYNTINGAMKSSYATTNRDEFLAEIITICRGCHINTSDYQKCGINTVELVREKMPDLYNIIQQYFIL